MSILDLIFPKTCLECKKEGVYICQSCLSKVQVLGPVCPYCEKLSIDGFTHVKCKKVLGLDGLTSIYRYEGVIKKAIHALKFKYATEVGKELSGIYADNLRKMPLFKSLPGAVTPIPIHWYRENVRGFNQSELIAIMVAQKVDRTYVPDILIKNRQTASQVELSVAERKKNLRGVFSLSSRYALSKTPDAIILFDDVFTTGSTLHEATKVLKRIGVQKVWGMTIAR